MVGLLQGIKRVLATDGHTSAVTADMLGRAVALNAILSPNQNQNGGIKD
jgi:hypothetical protein